MLSRMDNITLDDRPFLRRLDYQNEELLYGRSKENIPVTIKVNIEKSFSLLTGLPGKVVTRSLDNETLTLTFLIDDLDFINEWLLQFGRHVTICDPDILVEKRKEYLKELIEALQPASTP